MFKGKTVLERVDAQTYKLKSSLTFENDWIKVTIKSGLMTDGASIPRAFWSIIGCPLMGKYVGSALVHDALYDSQLTTREEADKLFIEMLADNGVGTVKRKLMYWAVRTGGGSFWNNKEIHTPEHLEEMRQFVTVKRK